MDNKFEYEVKYEKKQNKKGLKFSKASVIIYKYNIYI